jgi:hypothetical protein
MRQGRPAPLLLTEHAEQMNVQVDSVTLDAGLSITSCSLPGLASAAPAAAPSLMTGGSGPGLRLTQQ